MNRVWLFASLLVWAACGGSDRCETPEQAMRGLLEALNREDFEGAKNFATPRTYIYLREWEAMVRMSSEEERQLLHNDLRNVKCAEDQGVMTCIACCTPDGGQASLKMFQENNYWLVDFQIDL